MRRLTLTATFVIASFLLPTAAATASHAVIGQEDCTGFVANISVPQERVAPLLPDQFEIADPNQTGNATLAILAGSCDRFTIAGSNRGPVTLAAFRVAINDFDGANPDGTDQPLSDPGLVRQPSATYQEGGNYYQFWLVSNNRAMVKFYRDDAGASDHDAVYVEDLLFRVGLDGTFTFNAPKPTPYPFDIKDGHFGAPLTPPVNLWLEEWDAVPSGLMKANETVDLFRFGSVEGQVAPAPGSEMAKLFCNDVDGSFAGNPAGVVVGDPVVGITGGSLSFQLASNAFRLGSSKTRMSDKEARPSCPQ